MRQYNKATALLMSIITVLCFIPQSVLAQVGGLMSSDETQSQTTDTVTSAHVTEELYVLGEVIASRTETAKTFRMSDGSYVAADYGKSVHYADENGEWQDYDNTLSYTDASSSDSDDINGYGTAGSDVSFKLADNSNSSNLLKITKGDYKISLHLAGADKSKALEVYDAPEKPEGNDIGSAAKLYKFSSGAIYKDILPSVDLEYIISGSRVKENIIVKEKCDSYVYSFELKLKGLVPVLLEDGSVALNDETTSETALVIPKGYMYDAEGEYSSGVDYAISHKNGKKYVLTVTADSQWINSEDRAFPVTVDPTVEAFETAVTTYDTYISQQSPDSNFFTLHQSVAGYCNNNTSLEWHTLMRAESLPRIPASATVVDAKIRLAHLNTGYTSVNLAVSQITSAWESGTVTWNTKPDYAADGEILDYLSIDSSTNNTYIDFDITRLAQMWYNGTAENYGVAVYPVSGNGSGHAYFGSSDDTSIAPRLLISYRDTKGLEGIWTYSSHGAGSAGAGYVNGFNGNLVFVNDDMATKGSILPITVSHVYNSGLAGKAFTVNSGDINAPVTASYAGMNVGLGWKLSVQETVVKKVIGDITYYVYNDADGTELYFVNISGEYVSEDGYGLTLTVNSSSFTLEDDYGNKKRFDSKGRLTRITDVIGNEKNLVYNSSGQVTEVNYTPADSSESISQLKFCYNSLNALSKIEDSCDTSYYVEFYYSTAADGEYTAENSGYLRQIKYSSGAYSLYNYNTDGTLASVSDGDTGYTVSYGYATYYGNKHISLVSESVGDSSGQSIGFEYDDKLFKVRSSGNDDTYGNADDIVTTCLFDNFGRAVCAYSSDVNETELYGTSYAEYTSYQEASKQNNKVSVESVKGVTLENLIKNGNCETASPWIASANGSGYTAAQTTEQSRLGTGSLKLSGTGETGSASFVTMITLPSAGVYTLSAYVKLESVESESGGVSILADNEGSEPITGTTNTAIDGGWQCISYTFEATAAGSRYIILMLSEASGTAYFDCIQLEKYETPSEYNLMDDGGMRSDDFWNGSFSHVYNEESRGEVGRISGTPSAEAQAYQTVNLNSPVNTTFMLSGWARANSVDIADTESKGNRRFGMKAVLTYSDGTEEDRYIGFNPDNVQWQYASLAIVPNPENKELTVTSVTVYLCYDYNANSMYFDDICLTVEAAQTYKYDENGNLVTATDAEGNQTLMDYAGGVDLVEYTSVTGEEYSCTYRTVGGVDTHQAETVTKTVNGITQTLKYGYDAHGNAVSAVLTNSETDEKVASSASYGENGNYLVKSIDALGGVTGYDYDSVTKLLNYVEDANTNRTSYIYDSRYRVMRVYHDADRDGERNLDESSVRYIYLKNRLGGIYTNTTVYSLIYDDFGNVLSVYAGENVLATYDYGGNNGKLKKLTYGNGDYEEYEYDRLDRLVKVKYNGVEEYSIAYNANGGVYSIVDGGVTHLYEYDSLGRLIRAWQLDSTGAAVMAVENSFDELGRAKGSTYVAGDKTLSYTVSYKTDSSLVGRVLLPQCGILSSLVYSYDGLERLATKKVSMSSLRDAVEEYDYYSYTKNGETFTTPLVESVTLKTVNGANVLSSAEYSYTYDSLGNILTVSKDGALVESYEYDSLNQLTRENNATAGFTKLYYYDASGNITKKVEFGYTTTATSSLNISDGTVTSYTYGATNSWKDLLTDFNGTALTYDEIGNPLNWHNAETLTWEQRELQKVNFTANAYVNYSYNSGGIRTGREYVDPRIYTRSEHDYVLDGSKIIKEHIYVATITSITNIDLYYVYDASGEVIGLHYNNALYYFQKNLQGDVVGIVDTAGTVVVEYTYDAWGKVLTTTGSLASTVGKYNPFRYRSYYYDTETGWYYLQSRYYDPTVGRFLNADSQLSTGDLTGMNLYAYCGNNPVNRIDPTGEAWYHWALGAAVVVGCAIATVATCGGFAAAAGAVAAVGSGVAATTTASTIAAGAFIGSATVYGAAVLAAASTSDTVEEFNEQGDWGTVAATAGGAVVGGVSGYVMSGTQSTTTSSTHSASGTSANQPTSRGSTGRTEPTNLTEQLAMEQVRSDPYAGLQIKNLTLQDKRWLSEEGWVKMQQIIPTSQGDINIHYVYNQVLEIFDDFKFNS